MRRTIAIGHRGYHAIGCVVKPEAAYLRGPHGIIPVFPFARQPNRRPTACVSLRLEKFAERFMIISSGEFDKPSVTKRGQL